LVPVFKDRRTHWATRRNAVQTRVARRRVTVDRTEKREFVAGLHEALAATSMIVVTHNTGLTVAEATDLRRRMRAAGVTFKVAKNRLAHLALEGTPFDGLKPPAGSAEQGLHGTNQRLN
jgi:ribosomal protein L10